jgi:hypothetical protein
VRVVALWRYPVKSLQGETLEQARLTAAGVEGDRGYGIADVESGLVLTARREPRLLFASASVRTRGRPAITGPDGEDLGDDAALSAWLGRTVTLQAAGPGVAGRYEAQLDFEHEDSADWFQWEGPDVAFHDSARARVSLVSEASLGVWEARRFRPNVVLSPGDEDALVGETVAVGGAVLEIRKRIDRCQMVTRAQPGGIERDVEVLRTIVRDRDSCLAVGGLVLEPGVVAVGDELRPT